MKGVAIMVGLTEVEISKILDHMDGRSTAEVITKILLENNKKIERDIPRVIDQSISGPSNRFPR